ncbi:MAG: LysR family transcriptional regulator [Deltaproteobacteria bacterium HGW-Deltaproteobacteria-14]|jgi:DNA-binding transcriptional LysR family regulator|nr:MAG: LysR family transcriptional regulator [Deltaproteobacteria bacterium HGW-Deltaproteobacteria-14]
MSMREPSWDLYRTLLAVLREGSLSGAARALGLTQPTVSRHVDALEEALGGALFVRSPRGISATERASELRPYAEALASTAAALLRAASGHGAEVRGAVRLTASEIVGGEVLPPILAALGERHPDLVVELVLSNAAQDLLQRDADIAVRMFEPSQEALVARRIGDVAIGMFAHRRYLERRGTPATLADLAGHTLIGFDTETPALRAMLRTIPGLSRDVFSFRADSDLAQLAALRAGFGVSGCQLGVARRHPDLVRVVPALEFALPMWLVMHEDLRSTPRCRVVFDGLVEGLGAYVAGSEGAQGL